MNKIFVEYFGGLKDLKVDSTKKHLLFDINVGFACKMRTLNPTYTTNHNNFFQTTQNHSHYGHKVVAVDASEGCGVFVLVSE